MPITCPPATSGGRIIPPMLYVPTSGVGNEFGNEVELRRLDDGRTALLAYTALDRLSDCCGSHQPWSLVPTERLEELGQDQPFDIVLLDAEIPQALRHPPVEEI